MDTESQEWTSLGVTTRKNKIRAKTGDLTERERVILQLRDEKGLTYQEISEIYGISRERVRQILKMAGSKTLGHHPSRAARTVTCIDCGKVLNRSYSPDEKEPRCQKCSGVARTIWTDERLISVIQTYKDHYGEWPTAQDFNPALAKRYSNQRSNVALERYKELGELLGFKLPYIGNFQKAFGSWNNALRRAGKPESEIHTMDNVPGFEDHKKMLERMSEYLAAQLPIKEIALLEGVTESAIQQRLERIERGNKSRAKYSRAERESYAKMVLDEGKSIAELSHELNVQYGTVQNWVSKLRVTRELESEVVSS